MWANAGINGSGLSCFTGVYTDVTCTKNQTGNLCSEGGTLNDWVTY